VRVNRFAYRTFCRDPETSLAEFERQLGLDVFGSRSSPQKVADLLWVQACYFDGADWFRGAPLLDPARVRDQSVREHWAADRLEAYHPRVERLRQIARRYRDSQNSAERELQRLADLIVKKWDRARIFPGP
jgi:hypothetical protein